MWADHTGAGLMRRGPWVLALLVALSGSGCGLFAEEKLPPMTLERLDGRVRVVRGPEHIDVKGQFSIEPGDVVETMPGGLAEFTLEGDRRVKLASGSRVRIISTVALESLAGSLLAQTAETTRVRFGTIEASSQEGTFRIDTGFASVRAATFDGELGLTVAGERPLTVQPFFEARVSANDLPSRTQPYRLEASDIFDRDHLSKWVELDRTLNQLGDGLANQLGRSRPTLGYYSDLLDGRDVRFIRPYLRRPADELLIGLSIARNTDMALRRAFRDALGYVDQGAVWGIVAAILRADDTRSVVAGIRSAIEETGAVAAGQGGDADFVAAGGQAPGSGDLSTPDGGGDAAPPEDGGGGGSQPRDPDEPSPPPDDECGSPIDCALEGIGIEPSPSPTGVLSDL